MVTALGVAPDADGNGLEPLVHRKIIAAHWENTGIVGAGLQVSGMGNLAYYASAGMAVCSQGAVDGMVEAYWPGGQTKESVAAGDATYPRIDRIYLIAHTGSPDNLVSLHVAQGQPSASPVAPAIPAGALRVADMRMPAGARVTSSAVPAGSVDYAIPYGASMGRLGIYEDTRTDVWGDPRVRNWYYEFPVSFYVPTDRIVELVYNSDVSYQRAAGHEWMSWASTFQMDGVDVPHTSRETICRDGVWTHARNNTIVAVEKGHHVARMKNGIASKIGNGQPYFHYGENDGLTYPGRTLEVWDRGPTR